MVVGRPGDQGMRPASGQAACLGICYFRGKEILDGGPGAFTSRSVPGKRRREEGTRERTRERKGGACPAPGSIPCLTFSVSREQFLHFCMARAPRWISY